MILRLGTGDSVGKQEGYINVDIRPLPDVDVVADVRAMPFPDNYADGFESRNVVEHFGRYEIIPLLKEWARVIKPGGTFVIETVDFGATMDNWRNIPEDNMLDGMCGAQTYPENFHKIVLTSDMLERYLKEVGLITDASEKFVHREIPRMKLYGQKAN